MSSGLTPFVPSAADGTAASFDCTPMARASVTTRLRVDVFDQLGVDRVDRLDRRLDEVEPPVAVVVEVVDDPRGLPRDGDGDLRGRAS